MHHFFIAIKKQVWDIKRNCVREGYEIEETSEGATVDTFIG